MKNLTKVLLTLVLVAGFGVSTYAQQTDNDAIDAKAEVSVQVNVTEVEPLIFGVVTPGVTKTIDTEGDVIAGTAGNGATIGEEVAGQFSITKGTNTEVTLAFSLPTTLVKESDNLAINFTDALTGTVKLAKLAAFSGTQADLLFTPGSGITTVNADETAEYYAGNDFYVFIGGTVVPISTQAAGVYVGEITLTATYN